MALLDLSLVTRALARVVEEHVVSSPVWFPRSTPSVSPLPPDQLPIDAAGLYLYHVREDPHTRNLGDPGVGVTPVRHQPLGLSLYYQLSVNGVNTNVTMWEAQLLFGCAIKAFHDVPVITDETVVNGVSILAEVGLDGAGNRIRLTLQPLEERDAPAYWTAGSTALRTAAYYQASVILLEPEPPPDRAGRVRHYGVHTFVRGAPRLTGSENRVEYEIPGVPTVQQVVLRPAEVPVGDRVTFTGVDLAGEETQLILRSARWTEDRVADESWGVAGSDTRAFAMVRETLEGEAVLPGAHAARIRVVNRRRMPDGEFRRFAQASNATAFTIAPRIDAVSALNAAGEFTVTGYVFQHDELAEDDVELFLGAERAERGAAGGLAPGEFAVTAPDTLEARLPAGISAGSFVPVRVLVNGAESPPRWVEAP
jgi:hypothetical protein